MKKYVSTDTKDESTTFYKIYEESHFDVFKGESSYKEVGWRDKNWVAQQMIDGNSFHTGEYDSVNKTIKVGSEMMFYITSKKDSSTKNNIRPK